MKLPMSPVVAGLGQGALAGGLSAYGNLAEENDRSKGDQRMILESALAALGAGVAAARVRRAMNGHGAALTQEVTQRLRQASPTRFAGAKAFYQGSPLLSKLTPEQWMNLTATSLAAGVGAGIGGGGVAPFLANQFGLLQIPGSWTQRANDWNWDRQIPAEAAAAQQIASGVQFELQ